MAVCYSALEDEARRCAVSEQPALSVGDTAFCRADTTASVQYFALRLDLARLRSDGANERNFEFERRAAETFFKGRLNGQPHAAVEKCRRETTMNCPPWIEVRLIRRDRDDDTTGLGLDNVIAQSLRDGI